MPVKLDGEPWPDDRAMVAAMVRERHSERLEVLFNDCNCNEEVVWLADEYTRVVQELEAQVKVLKEALLEITVMAEAEGEDINGVWVAGIGRAALGEG